MSELTESEKMEVIGELLRQGIGLEDIGRDCPPLTELALKIGREAEANEGRTPNVTRQGVELHVGADLRDRLFELEREGWIQITEDRRQELMRLG